MLLPKNESVLFQGNVVLHMDLNDELNGGLIVTSTGNPDEYKVEKGIRKGMYVTLTSTYFDVCNLALEFHISGANMKKNLLFANGIQTAIEICAEEFNRKAEVDEDYMIARNRIHAEWEEFKFEEEKSKTNTGAGVGVCSPTGKIYGA